MKKIAIINGPNLNLLGNRENEIYGSISFEVFLADLKKNYPTIELIFFQSNIEGEIINILQDICKKVDGIIINPAGYTHTSVAIGDTLATIGIPKVEVHISNVHAREEFRKISHVSAKVNGSIIGLGLNGYKLAIDWILMVI